MTAQLSLFAPATPAAELPLPGADRASAASRPWALTLRVNREQNCAWLTCDKTPSDLPALQRAARGVGLPVRESGVLIAPVGYTPLGEIGGEFLKYLARQYPERVLQVWRTTETETPPPAPTAPAEPPLDPRTLTAPRSRSNSTNCSTKRSTTPPAPPVTPAEPYAPPITRAARHTWPVNFTVYANGQTVITCAEWGLELFRQTATRHNYHPDGDAVVTAVQRVDSAQPWDESNVRLDDQAEAFVSDLPYTGLCWHFQFCDLPLPEQYTPAISPAVPEAEDASLGWDHIYTIDFEDSRADLLAAGDLVDVTATAREAGLRPATAVTRALWTVIEDIPPAHNYQSVSGRLWDLVSMAYLAARQNPESNVVHFKLIMHHENRVYLDVTMTIGPGDAGEPVVTIMLPKEE